MNKKSSFVFLLLLCGAWLFSACYYDKADVVYPPASTCDTSNASYINTVVPILNRSCYSCHSGTAASGAGIKLDSYTNLKIQITNGRLLGAINHTSGFSAMPQGNPKLQACDISKITAWVNAGSPNN